MGGQLGRSGENEKYLLWLMGEVADWSKEEIGGRRPEPVLFRSTYRRGRFLL